MYILGDLTSPQTQGSRPATFNAPRGVTAAPLPEVEDFPILDFSEPEVIAPPAPQETAPQLVEHTERIVEKTNIFTLFLIAATSAGIVLLSKGR